MSDQGPMCPYGCGDLGDGERITASENMVGLGGEFVYARCRTCRSLVLLDVPDDLAPFYPQDYYSFDAPGAITPNPVFSTLMKGLLPLTPLARRLGRGRLKGTVFPVSAGWFAGLGVRQSSRILEVGTGGGAVLGQLRRLGFSDLAGIDPFLAEPERRLGDIVIRRSTLEEVTEPSDVIIFHHVLEHVADPVDELRRARERLRPGGHVLAILPLSDSAAFETYGADWVQLDAPRHLTLPTEAAMRAGAERAGCEVVDHWRTGTAFQFWGSEQYRKGIPLVSERSWHVDAAASPWTPEQVAAWDKQAQVLNRQGRGDEGAFTMRAA